MSEKSEIHPKAYRCIVCNKSYSSHSSLCNHNKKFHNNTSQKVLKYSDKNSGTSENIPINSETNKIYSCRCCNKVFYNVKTRWSHEKICKQNKKIDDNITILKEENKNKELELQIKKEEKEILKLKLKLEKSEMIDNVTLRQLNKKLMERNNLIKKSMVNSNINSHNTNNIQNNNVINNTFQLVGFGKEDIVELLTMSEKKQIMNARMGCLEKLIEIVHCGNYNQFKNIIVTNMKDGLVYKYVDTVGQFKLATKSEAINHLVDSRFDDIQIIYNELINYNKIDEKTKNLIEKFINNFQDPDKKFYDMDNKEYPSFKHYKINEVKILLYNNQDKITNDIALLLTATDDPPCVLP
jgi:hypothetical protein